MRIIAGKANRKALVTLPGEEITRPTIERVKEGMFSAIQFDIAGRRVLDLFSGCGQIGLEAVSRGADCAVLIDSSVDAVEIIKQNAKNTGLMKQCRISRMDYSEYLKSAANKEKFDLVFLDPPYAKDMKAEILKKLMRANILNDGAIIVCETNVDFYNDGDEVYTLTFKKKYRYGKVFITMFTYNERNEGDVTNE